MECKQSFLCYLMLKNCSNIRGFTDFSLQVYIKMFSVHPLSFFLSLCSFAVIVWLSLQHSDPVPKTRFYFAESTPRMGVTPPVLVCRQFLIQPTVFHQVLMSRARHLFFTALPSLWLLIPCQVSGSHTILLVLTGVLGFFRRVSFSSESQDSSTDAGA